MDHRNFIHILAFKTPINTQDPPLPLRNIVLIQHPVTVHSSVIAIGRYFQLILHADVVSNCPNCRI